MPPRGRVSLGPPRRTSARAASSLTNKEAAMPKSKAAGLTRRQMLKVGGAATFAGYAGGVEKALGQAIKTDTQGIVAGDATVPIGSYKMPGYEARPANATNAPIVMVISEICGVHEGGKDIKAPFLGLYGEKDTGPSPEDARKFGDLLKQTNPNSEIVIYPGVGHGFFADYRPSYNAEAAADAWKRCTGLFAKTLKA